MPLPPKVKWIIAGSILATLLVLALLARPTWGLVKAWRADNLAAEARAHMEEGDLQTAWENAQTAYLLNPTSPAVARTVAQVYDKADPHQAVEFWLETYKLSDERSDLIALIKAAIIAQQLDLAEEKLQLLKPLDTRDGQPLYLRARLLVARQDIPAATQAASQAVAKATVPHDAHYLYVQLTQFSQDPAIRAEGIAYLRRLASQQDQLGLDSLRNLSNYTDNTEEEVRWLIRQLNKHPLGTREDRLLALLHDMRLPGADPHDNFQRAVKLFNLSDLAELTELGRWLNQQGRQVQTLEIIDAPTARRRQDLFLVRLDALASLGRWDEVSQILADSTIPIEPYLRQLFQARVLYETGQTSRADFAWSRAVIQVASDPQKLWYLHEYARRLGLTTQSREALQRLTLIPSARRKAYEELVNLEQREGSVLDLRNRLREMAGSYPNDLVVRNDLAYANLLLGQNIDESTAVAEKLVSDGSPYLANRVTLALGYYKQGHPTRALDVLAPLDIDWIQARDGFRAVYAAILRANGLNTEANKLIAHINPMALLREERELLAQTQG